MIGNTCCMQTAREIFDELDKAIRKNKDELTFGGYSKDIINSIKEKYLHSPQRSGESPKMTEHVETSHADTNHSPVSELGIEQHRAADSDSKESNKASQSKESVPDANSITHIRNILRGIRMGCNDIQYLLDDCEVKKETGA